MYAASATASPFHSGAPTPQHPLSPVDQCSSAEQSACHTPTSISVSVGGQGSQNSKQPGGNPYSNAFLTMHDSRRDSAALGSQLSVRDGQCINYSMDAGGAGGSGQQPSLGMHFATPTQQSRRAGSSQNDSRIMFHMEGTPRTMGLGLSGTAGSGNGGENLFGGYNPEYDRDDSRSDSITPPPPSSAHDGPLASNLSAEQLGQIVDILAAGIVIGHEIKRKDAAGKVYQNCFTGKEAMNCLRHKLPKSHSSASDCLMILQQMLQEGFLVVAQSIEELDKSIAEKFKSPPNSPPPPTSGSSTPVLKAQKSPNPLALKLNLSAIGAAAPPAPALPVFKKEGLYVLSHSGGSAGSSANTSAANSLRSSPVMFASGAPGSSLTSLNLGPIAPASGSSSAASAAGVSCPPLLLGGNATWFLNYAGFLGKKRENKGLGNSLALGLGVSTFQRRWFQVSIREQAVLYFKEDPHVRVGALADETKAGANTKEVALPLGFIPFSEILLVDHIQSSTNQLAQQQSSQGGSPMVGGSNSNSKKKKPSFSGSATPPVSSAPVALCTDEKTGRLFDIIASFRIYHLQADSTMDAMKWVQAIKLSIAEAANLKAERMLGNPVTMTLNAAASNSKTMQASATLGGGVKTPRTPEVNKRFWSNTATPLLNASAFPSKYLAQVLKDSIETGRNGILGAPHIAPQRLSNLRKNFFELHFSISSLDQPSFFDSLSEEFPTDAAIVEFCWNCITRGTSNVADTEKWGPKAFRAGAKGMGVGCTSAASAASASSPTKVAVDISASTVLLARQREAEHLLDMRMEDEFDAVGEASVSNSTALGRHESDADEAHMSSSLMPAFQQCLPRAPKHRRCISGSILPDFIGRSGEREASRSKEGHKREDSFNLSALEARRVLNATRPFHRRFSSSVYPLPRSVADRSLTSEHVDGLLCGRRKSAFGLNPAVGSKFHDFQYMLLNRYALYHASALKALSTSEIVADTSGDAMANPAFLYRIFAPYKRMEAWLATDCFLNLLLNDSALLNEVPLALPLIWLVLQWRNHDSDPHAHASSGSKDEQFIDDACLRKNWMDPSVDGEDDGFSGGDSGVGEQGVASAEEAAAVRENKDEAVKAGFRSVARAHLRVTSFSTVADPFGALRAAANLASNSASNMASAGSPMSPQQPLSASAQHHAPVVYGANGQIMMGMRGSASPQSSPMGHGHHHMSPHLMPLSLGGVTPQSPSAMFEYDAASGSPLPPFTPNPLSPPAVSGGPVHVHLEHPLQPPPMVRAYSTPNQQGLSVQIGPVSLPPTHGMTPTKAHPLPKRLSGNGPSSAGAHSPHSGSPGPQQARNSTSGNSSDHSGPAGGVTFDLAENVIGVSGEHEHSVSSGSRGGDYEHEPGAARKSIDSYGSEGVPRGSASMPNTRRNSLNPSAAASAAAASAASAAHQSKRSSDSGNSIYLTPRQIPRSSPPSAASSASARTSPAPGMRQRGTIFQAGNATTRPPNLLSGAGGGYATLRPSATASSSSVSPAQPPPIPLGLPHWKVRSLIGCKFCFQSSVEFMQAISERYGIDGRAAEAARKKRALERAAREAEEANAQGGGSGHKSPLTAVKVKGRMVLDPPLKQPGEFTIALSNTLFSLLLNPLYSLPSINACAKVGGGGNGGNNPAASDSFNVLGKTITQPHIWPTIIACLQSTKISEEKRKLTSSSSRKPGFIPGTGKLRSPSTSSFETLARAPFLKHHVLKDLNTLFIGSNVAVTNRNCALLFKFFDAVSKRERKVLQAQRDEKEREKKLSDKEREKLERRRKRHPVAQRPMIGAWQQGLLELMRAHVPAPAAAGVTPLSPTKGKSQLDLGIDRLHSKIYQYGLNLFGVFHFYRFQCIGNGAPLSAVTLAMQGKLKEVGSPSAAAREKAGSHTTAADFERLFRESFWRAMHMCDGQTSASGKPGSDSKRASPVGGASSSSSSSSSSSKGSAPKLDSTLSHTVARSLLTTMIQRLMFKIKSKTLIMDGRWPALAFLVQLVKSFVFSLPLKVAAGSTVATGSAALALATGTSGSGSGLLDPLLGFDQDFASGHEGLHRSAPTLSGGLQLSAIQDDIDLLEKALELLKALRLYQDLDVEHMPLGKQRDIKAHVEASAHASSTSSTSRSGGRGGELHDPQSKLKLNSAHEDLSMLFQNLIPSDQIAFKFLQGHVSFTKDAICFLAMMNAHRRAEGMEEKELQQLVSHFVTMERREKVFCSK